MQSISPYFGAAKPVLHLTVFKIFGQVLKKSPFPEVWLIVLGTYLEVFLNFLELIRCIDLIS